MQIYLVQHGKALDKSVDPERGLSSAGINEIKEMVKQTHAADLPVSSILHSGKLRAEQTANLYAEGLNVGSIHSITGMNPNDHVEDFFNTHHLDDNTMLVGHLPFLSRLTSYLINGKQEPQIVQFQNAGIVCLQREDTGKWFIKWTLYPQHQ